MRGWTILECNRNSIWEVWTVAFVAHRGEGGGQCRATVNTTGSVRTAWLLLSEEGFLDAECAKEHCLLSPSLEHHLEHCSVCTSQ
jgi:hypothetical protein